MRCAIDKCGCAEGRFAIFKGDKAGGLLRINTGLQFESLIGRCGAWLHIEADLARNRLRLLRSLHRRG